MPAIINQSFKTMCSDEFILRLQKEKRFDLKKFSQSRILKRMIKEYTEKCALNIHTYYSQNDIKEALDEIFSVMILFYEGKYEVSKKHRNKLKKFYLKGEV